MEDTSLRERGRCLSSGKGKIPFFKKVEDTSLRERGRYLTSGKGKIPHFGKWEDTSLRERGRYLTSEKGKIPHYGKGGDTSLREMGSYLSSGKEKKPLFGEGEDHLTNLICALHIIKPATLLVKIEILTREQRVCDINVLVWRKLQSVCQLTVHIICLN